MVELITFTSDEFPESLKWQAVSFLRVQYPLGFVNENRLRDWVTREDDHPIHIVLVEKGILISHTNVVWKYLDHVGETYKTYGLTGVFTYPSFRRQGYGSRVIKAGTDYILKSDTDIAMFYCDEKLVNFYARHGWMHMDKSVSYTGEKILLAYVIAIPSNEIVIPTVLMLTVHTLGLQGMGAGAGVLFELESVADTAAVLHAGGWGVMTGVCLMLFSLLHNPCSTTIYTISKETGSLRWTVVATLLPLAMGLVVCFVVAQVWRGVGERVVPGHRPTVADGPARPQGALPVLA